MIELTTPYDPGSKDPGRSYTHVALIAAKVDVPAEAVRVQWQYGTVVDTVFIPGKEPPISTPIEQPYYEDIMELMPEEGETAFEAWARACLQMLLDLDLVAGTHT